MSWNGKEQRGERRYAVMDCAVRFTKAGPLSFLSPFSSRYLLVDLSLKGLCLMAGEPLAAGDRLNLQVETADIEGRWSCQARVVWVSRSDRQEAYRAGLVVTKISGADSARMRTLLDKCLIEKKEISTSLFLKKIKRM